MRQQDCPTRRLSLPLQRHLPPRRRRFSKECPLLLLSSSKGRPSQKFIAQPRRRAVVGNKLLIVEDNAMMREMFTIALSDAGFSVITADDGYAGLDRARAERPDL